MNDSNNSHHINLAKIAQKEAEEKYLAAFRDELQTCKQGRNRGIRNRAKEKGIEAYIESLENAVRVTEQQKHELKEKLKQERAKLEQHRLVGDSSSRR